MDTLFPLERVLPEGFVYVPDFITRDEEARLCGQIEGVEFKAFNFQGYEAKRRIATFGYDWSFEHRHNCPVECCTWQVSYQFPEPLKSCGPEVTVPAFGNT